MYYYMWIGFVVLIGGFVKGLSGFGPGLVVIPLLIVYIDIKTVVPLIYLLDFVGSALLLFQLLKKLNWKELYPLLVGYVPGVIIGVFFLKTLDVGILRLILGIILLSYSVYGLFFDISNVKIWKGWAYLVGFLSGGLGGTIGANGPPIIVYTSAQQWSKDKIRVTLQGYFCITNLITIMIQAYNGLITTVVVKYFGFSLLIFLLGIHIGSRFYGTLGNKTYKRVIFVILVFLGAFTIYRTF
jgi:uncharacterized protein